MEGQFPLLLAAGWEQVLQFAVPFLFLVIWIISQIVEAKKQVVPPREGAPGPPPEPHQPAPRRLRNEPPPAADRAADPLREQVDEFLRRAGRGAQDQRPPRRPPAKVEEIEVLLDDDVAAPRREPLSQPLRPIARPAAAPERPAVNQPKKPRPPRRLSAPHRETVAEHVAERMGSSDRTIGQGTTRLGQRIIEEDAEFDVQLKAKFDHTVGTLAGSTLPATALEPIPASDSPAARIAAMLSNRDGIRQAIVINEVLRRPTDRW